jgi:hypothetical protein
MKLSGWDINFLRLLIHAIRPRKIDGMSDEKQKIATIRSIVAPERALLEGVEGLRFSDEPWPVPEHSLAVVAERGRKVVGTITAERVWLVSNFYLERKLRGSGLAGEMAALLQSMNSEGLTEILSTTSPHVELLAHRMGFVAIKGSLFRH